MKQKYIFLSYAEEDSNLTDAVYNALCQEFSIYKWQDPKNRGEDFIQKMENEIAKADIFLVVWSPYYESSYWCDQERKLALRTEANRKTQNPQYSFIYVVNTSSEGRLPSGFLGGLDTFDLTPKNRAKELVSLIEKLKGASVDMPHPVPSSTNNAEWLTFQNREVELENILQNLRNPAGEHFWLVIAGPQMGKTWFLDEIPRRLVKQINDSSQWVFKKIDLHNESSDLRSNTLRLLASLFGISISSVDGDDIVNELARVVSKSNKPWLLLVDSGELLADEIVKELRAQIGAIYRILIESGNIGLRITCVVASRKQHQSWKPVSPKPRISILHLTHFKPSIIDNALRLMTKLDQRGVDDAWYRNTAGGLYNASEGLPALLLKYMEEIRNSFRYVISPGAIESRKTFDKVAAPYIKNVLLSIQNLIPYGGNPNLQKDKQLAIELSLLLLSSYRLFTYSHLKHVVDQEPELESLLNTLKWSINDLWQAIRDTDLMKPIDNPWREVYSAIRRLLFQYKFTKTEEQIAAHQQAGKYYIDRWQNIGSGNEQSVFLIECLWHQAEQFRLAKSTYRKNAFIQFSQNLLENNIHSNGYVRSEILEYVEDRLSKDEEMEEALESIESGLFAELLKNVQNIKDSADAN